MTDMGLIITPDTALGKTLGGPILRAPGGGAGRALGALCFRKDRRKVQALGMEAGDRSSDWSCSQGNRQRPPSFRAWDPASLWNRDNRAPRALLQTLRRRTVQQNSLCWGERSTAALSHGATKNLNCGYWDTEELKF